MKVLLDDEDFEAVVCEGKERRRKRMESNESGSSILDRPPMIFFLCVYLCVLEMDISFFVV